MPRPHPMRVSCNICLFLSGELQRKCAASVVKKLQRFATIIWPTFSCQSGIFWESIFIMQTEKKLGLNFSRLFSCVIFSNCNMSNCGRTKIDSRDF